MSTPRVLSTCRAEPGGSQYAYGWVVEKTSRGTRDIWHNGGNGVYQAEMHRYVDEGVLIQMVQGLHSGVNPVSGDFSTGASGLMIRQGQLAEPVREFTIVSTLQRMLKDVDEVGGDVEWLPMGAAGVSLVIRDVTMSGA